MTDEQRALLERVRLIAEREARGSAPTTLHVRRVLMPDGYWYVNGVKQEPVR